MSKDLSDRIHGLARPKHLIGVGVAVFLGGLGFEYGGYASDITSAVAILAWVFIAVGAGLGLLPRNRFGNQALVSIVLIAALTAVTALSITWAVDAGIAFRETARMLAVTSAFLLVLLLSARGEARSWLHGIAFGLGFLVLLAAASRYFPGLGDDDTLSAQLTGIIGGRLSWPLGYWNAVGSVAAILLMELHWLSVHARASNARAAACAAVPVVAVVLYLCSSRGALLGIAAGLVVLFAMGPRRSTLSASFALAAAGCLIPVVVGSQLHAVSSAEVTSTARSQGLILLALTLASTGATFYARRALDGRVGRLAVPDRLGWSAVGILALALLAVVLAVHPAERIESFTAVPTEPAESRADASYATEHLLSGGGNGRWQLWKSAVGAFSEEPLRGIGLGGFEAWFKVDGEIWFKTIDAHSLPLQTLAELGAIGFLLLVGLVGWCVYCGFVRWQEARVKSRLSSLPAAASTDGSAAVSEIPAFLSIVAVGAVVVSIDWTGNYPVVFVPLMIALGMLAGPAYESAAARAAVPAPAWLRVAGVGALVVVAGAAIVVAAKQYESTTRMDESRAAFDRGDLPEARARALDAHDATPFSGEPLVQVALIDEYQGRLRSAERHARMAVQSSAANDSYWLLLARIQGARGKPAEAAASYRRAQSLNPKAPVYATTP